MTPHFRLFSLSLGGVYYKDDESRFSQQYTVKLKTYSQYNVQLEVKPPHEICYIKIGGKTYREFVTQTNENDEEISIYSFTWSTNRIRTTKRKHRSILPCVVKFHNRNEIKFDIFVKFYFSCEVNHYTGIPLSFIEVDYGTKVKNGVLYPIPHKMRFR